MKPLYLLASLFLILSCSHTAPKSDSYGAQSNAVPAHAFQSSNPSQITIAVVGLNDFHGSLMARERKLADGTIVKSGGAPALASMIKILKQEMNNRVLIVDAGDEWQGTLESNQTQGATVVDFYNRIGVNVAAIGNHEFDFSIPSMQHQIRGAHYPYVASNILIHKTQRRPFWKNVTPSVMIDIPELAPLRIGVIGVSTVQTPGTTRYEYVKHLDFVDAIKPVTDESAKLRKNGANLVLVTAHAGTTCEDRDGLKEWTLRDSNTKESKCSKEEEIYQLADHLKAGTLDGIVSGHTHQVIHHWFNGIPVIQDEAYNQHFNIIYYTFDANTKKLIPELTKIEGLVPICEEMFESLNHCDVRRLPAGSSPKRVPAQFHGKVVVPDPAIADWLNPIIKSTEKFRNDILATAEMPLTHFRDHEGAFGNLIADTLLENSKADFALVNGGGIRTSLDAGPITADGIYRALPFDNLLNVIKLKGSELKLLMRIATAGGHGFISVAGLKLKVVSYQRDVEKTDLNGDGKLEAWESNRLLSIKTADGQEIQDDKIYTVATFDYLVNGGDDLSWFMKRIPAKDISKEGAMYCRDMVTAHLKKMKVVNTHAHPLVDPAHPRIEVVN